MTDFKRILENLNDRYNPEKRSLEKMVSLSSSLASDITDIQRYVYLSMMAVDESYTRISKEAGERVKAHLQKEQTNVTYRYQGSVMTDTHIRGYSDIDLLTICEEFYSFDRVSTTNVLESAQRNYYNAAQISKLQSEINSTPYLGNANKDLRNLRESSERALSNMYDRCNISHAKAIKITNQDLHRDVDIVTASWYDDVRSIINDKGIYRGIQVYDKVNDCKCDPDYPFVSIDRINSKSSETNGRLKRMIRFLKNVKSDSIQDIDLSSFDINAICYDIKKEEYINDDYLHLVTIIWLQIYKIITDENYANRITSVDGKEYIFRGNKKREELQKLHTEVFSIYQALKNLHLL